MHLQSIELSGFKSFAKKSTLKFTSPIAGIVGPNGSGKSNAAEAFRFVLGEQSMKSMRGRRGPDMIWAGNERMPQANRARVSIQFNNKSNLFDIDFDEVVVERIVHRDGANEYTINGSKVRLKDIAELLSSANIGASGHHIISQGEADRILSASIGNRREMVEEALGLRAFQFKKAESEKKLEKTSENMKEVGILRRELTPQLTHLERQMKKLERSRELRTQLKNTYRTYIGRERAYIFEQGKTLENEKIWPTQELSKISEELLQQDVQDETKSSTELKDLDERVNGLKEERLKLENARGRIEGQLSLVSGGGISKKANVAQIPFVRVEEFLDEVEEKLIAARKSEDTYHLDHLIERIENFLAQFQDSPAEDSSNPDLVASLELELKEIEESLDAFYVEEGAIVMQRANALSKIEDKQNEEREAQRHFFELKEKKIIFERDIAEVQRKIESLNYTKKSLESVEWRAQDLGVNIRDIESVGVMPREDQVESLREIEKTEVRLEESGGVDESVVREYEELKIRDEFLEREINDLEQSKLTLLDIINSLSGELTTRFDEGLVKINEEFQKFFQMLFDGGEASLKVVRTEEEETKDGIEIRVQLPRKKVATLDVLSGGERALASIALIFAMSQVNPPPFIILDETDAALDEANSKRYADMVKELSKKSQLILITHNRQTMEAAGELYGVTMGSDGISKLLSVKFEEALSVAK